MDKSIMDILRGIIKEAEGHQNWPKAIADFGKHFVLKREPDVLLGIFAILKELAYSGYLMHCGSDYCDTFNNSFYVQGPEEYQRKPVANKYYGIFKLNSETFPPIKSYYEKNETDLHIFYSMGIIGEEVSRVRMYYQGHPFGFCDWVSEDNPTELSEILVEEFESSPISWMASLYLMARHKPITEDVISYALLK
jgi:hypothetical protein